MLQQIIIVFSVLALLTFLNSCEHKPIEAVVPMQKDTSGNNTGNNNKCNPDSVYFVNDILPILNSNCAQSGCHDALTQQDNVRLDNYNSIMSTGDIKPGNPNGSDLYEVITESDPDKRMPPPPALTLSSDQKEKIRKWIQQGAKNNSCNVACDTTNFTYSGSISAILSKNCVACHTGGTFNLSTYNGVKSRVDDGKLWGAINHSLGFKPMPMGGAKLSDCDRKVIKKWIDTGAPNN